MVKLSTLFQQCGISSLPINLTSICQNLGIEMTTYECYSQFKGISQKELVFQFYSDAFTLSNGKKTIIVYNQAQGNLPRRRFTFAHEIGHILLGHLSEVPEDGATHFSSIQKEREADSLAIDLLAPLVVLHLMGVSTSFEIQQLCDISAIAADIRLQELQQMRQDAPTLTEEDRLLAMQFLPYISHHLCVEKTRRTMFFRSTRDPICLQQE